MTQFNFQLNLKDSDSQIQKKILTALKEEVLRVFKIASKTIKRDVRWLIMSRLRSQPEYKALQAGGKLFAEFGLDDPMKVERIITIFADSITVFVLFPRIYAGGIKGGIEIRAVPSDYNDVLADDSAYQQTEDGVTLEWLRWLLTEGTRRIVNRYEFKSINSRKNSRTGQGVMVPSKRSWGVPPEYSGTVSNNWVTRAFENIEDEISNIVERSIKNAM